MKTLGFFRRLTRFEWCLWISSMALTLISFFVSGDGHVLSLIASLIGATALIFVARGEVPGMVLSLVFSILYAVISLEFRYYGEMITYLCMSAPINIVSIISWVRHPYRDTTQVRISRLKRSSVVVLFVLAVVVTAAFYFILKAFDTANLEVSTLSVGTSFLASGLLVLRSPMYAVAYMFNDVVLIALWVMACVSDISYLPMVMCFVMFFVNDSYCLANWTRMRRAQESAG